MQKTSRRGVRPLLLVLLWGWSVAVFLVVDLFWNVEAFDEIRPRARLYRATRFVAHRMVGEPNRDREFDDDFDSLRAIRYDSASLGDRLSAVAESRDPRYLAAVARGDFDPRIRASALRRLVLVAESRARPILREVIDDREEADKVRTEAARLLGRTGPDAEGELLRLAGDGNPLCVRMGALAGLVRVETPGALARVVKEAREGEPKLRAAAIAAVGESRSESQRPVLLKVAGDPGASPALRVAACRAVGRGEASAAPPMLAALVADEVAPEAVREEAARALGRIGDPTALSALDGAAASGRIPPAVAREVRIARARLAIR